MTVLKQHEESRMSDDELAAASHAVDFDADEATCPACGAAFATTHTRCPDCGLNFG